MNNNNQDNDENDIYTSVEPVISYCSSSINCGVSTILSSREIRPSKKLDMLFTPISSISNNSFSLCNTIMLPYIINEESIDISPNENKDNISNVINAESSKEKQQISFIRDKTSYNTLSVENKDNEENIQQKDNENNNYLFGKNCSYSLKKVNKIFHGNDKLYEEKNKKIENEDEDDINESNEDENNKMSRGKSFKIGENAYKTTVVEKSEKGKKIKLKERSLFLKVSSKNKTKKQNNKKCQNSLEKSKSHADNYINKKLKDKIDFMYKVKTSKFCHNYLDGNKKSDKDNSELFYKKKLRKSNRELSGYIEDDDEDKDEDDEDNKKTIKNVRKISNVNEDGKRNSNISRSKYNIDQYHKMKYNKSFHLKTRFNMLREHLKYKKKDDHNDEQDNEKEKDKDKDKGKDKSSLEKNNNIGKEIKGKNKKYQRKKTVNFFLKEDKEKTVVGRNKNEKRKTFTLEGGKTVNKFKKQIIEKLKQKGKKEKNKEKDKDKMKGKDIYTSGPLLKKDFFSSNKNIHLDENKDIERSNSYLIKRIKRRSSVICVSSISDEDRVKKKKICNDDLNKNTHTRETKSKKKINKKKIDFDDALENNKKNYQLNLFSKDKFTNTEVRNSDYLKYTLNCMGLILDMDTEKQTRLKNKVNLNFKKSKKTKIALFDLDETLVHCTGDIKITKEKYQHVIQVTLPGKQTIQVGINIRPYWKQTLNLIKKKYYIVIYTASHHAYADAVLDFMDPKKKYFKYRLYRNNCALNDVEGAQFYVKDLDIFTEHYNLKDIVIIDNSVLSFAYHLHNGIPIVPYYDEDKDGSLYVIGLYLMHISNEEDLREANKKYINLDSFLEEAKKRKEENISEDGDANDDEIYLEEDNELDEGNNKENNEINEENNKTENKTIENKTGLKSIINIKNFRNSIKKFPEKKVSFKLKKKLSLSQISERFQRKRSAFFEDENNKLKSKSKLFKMYDVVKDDSPKSDLYMKKNESFDELSIYDEKKTKTKNKNENNVIIEEKNENENENLDNHINHDHDHDNNYIEEVDCKSDHIFEQNLPDDDDEDEKEEPPLCRGFTIREDLIQEFKDKNNDEKNGKNIKCKLGFIRSNFYNNFKNM